MTITIEQIHQAANQLVEQGINPTQMAVRKQLGGGSFSTIGEGLKSWRVMQDTNAQLAQVAIPTAIGERAELLVAQLWDTAQSLANEYLNKERENLAHEKALIRAELEEMRGMVATFEEEQEKTIAKLEHTKALLVDCTTQKEQLQLELTKTCTECIHLNDKLADKEHYSKELEKHIGKLADENKAMATEIARLSSRNQFKQDEIDRLTTEINAKEQKHQAKSQEQYSRLENAQAKLATITQENALLQGRNDTLVEQLNKMEISHQTLLTKIEELTAELATIKASTKVTTPKTKRKTVKTDMADQLNESLL